MAAGAPELLAQPGEPQVEERAPEEAVEPLEAALEAEAAPPAAGTAPWVYGLVALVLIGCGVALAVAIRRSLK